MSQQMSLNIIDSSEVSRNSVRAYLQPYADMIRVSGTADSLESGAGIIHKTLPNLVLLEVNDVQQGVREVSYITNTFPRTSVIVSSAEKSSDWILSLMRAGAVEYLVQPIKEEELKQTLQKVGRFIFPEKQAQKKYGKVISIYYPTGGIGTTTIAVNLASALAVDEKKVALVDLNLNAGDLSTFLNINPQYTLSSVTANMDRLDVNFLMSAMTRHTSGPYVLTEPNEVSEAIAITPEQIHRTLDLIRRNFDYVIADCGGPLAGITAQAFSCSDLILLNTALTLPVLKNAKRYLAALDRHGIWQDKVKLLVNRCSPKAGIQLKDAEKVLDRSVFHTIPNEFADVVASINKGIPLIKLLPRSPVSRAILKLADCVKG